MKIKKNKNKEIDEETKTYFLNINEILQKKEELQENEEDYWNYLENIYKEILGKEYILSSDKKCRYK